jgi:hypothetical protein
MVRAFFDNFWAKFFGIFIFGHFFCPFFEIPKYFAQKPDLCDHILILWSQYQKNNFQFVSINFFYKYLKIFSNV